MFRCKSHFLWIIRDFLYLECLACRAVAKDRGNDASIVADILSVIVQLDDEGETYAPCKK